MASYAILQTDLEPMLDGVNRLVETYSIFGLVSIFLCETTIRDYF